MDLSKFMEQWALVMSAPIPHIIALFLGLGIIWGINSFSYSTILSSKNANIELLQGRIAAYQDN